MRHVETLVPNRLFTPKPPGAYGKVRIGTHRLTSTRVAVKQIPKAMSASLTREIHHHRRLHHPNVTQLYEVIATETSIWLITELCSGGELYDYLVEKGRLTELETRQIFGELCLALHYVHSQGVVHRDLKLENVLLDERCHVKLSDFGFTREYEQGRFLETYCGTTGYAAPEMLLCQRYTGTGGWLWPFFLSRRSETSLDDVDRGGLLVIRCHTLLSASRHLALRRRRRRCDEAEDHSGCLRRS